MTLERNSKLINKKFISYLIPSILMVFAMQFGSLLDGILVGNMISTEALGGISLVTPILYIIQMPGFAIGMGGSIVVANLLGKRDIEKSKKVFSFCMVVGMGLSLIFTALAFIVSNPLAKLFGETSLAYTEPYLLIFLATDPIITLVLILGSFMAVDNNPRLSSAMYIISNVAKVGLEILFIKVFDWGVYGAAASTAAGYLFGLITVIFYMRSKSRLLSLSFKLDASCSKEIIKASSTTGVNLALTAVQMLVVNIFIGKLITDVNDLMIYGLISNMVFAFDLFCGGVYNIVPTLCGIFYGEKDYYSLRSITKKAYLITIIITIIITAIILITPETYAIIFGYEVGEDFSHAAMLLRVYVASFLPYEINKFSMNYYPSIDKTPVSLVTVFSRELVVVLPLTLALLFTNGLFGYSLACALTELITVIITYAYILIYNHIKKNKYKGIFMIEKADVISFDVSVDNEFDSASIASSQIVEFAKSQNVPERDSQVVGIAVEEIVNNISTYGYKKSKKSYIDIALKKVDDTLLLRIRDDGLPFDPTKYEFDNDEKYSTSGILLIKGLTDKMSYMRVLNLNNTIFEIYLKGATANGN